ncbi:MAG: phosphoribosyl transferase domain protein, partial [Proteobacteria bacterium]|nr:phosphoribosyl transferase domain protein [Pseudomonadota bacterium]
QLAQEHIRSFAPADLKVAVLHHKQVSPVTPDFYAQKVVTWRWLIYPWAVVEDVSGFLSAMSPRPASPEEALSKLHRSHGITLSRESLESVLAAMAQDGKESR